MPKMPKFKTAKEKADYFEAHRNELSAKDRAAYNKYRSYYTLQSGSDNMFKSLRNEDFSTDKDDYRDAENYAYDNEFLTGKRTFKNYKGGTHGTFNDVKKGGGKQSKKDQQMEDMIRRNNYARKTKYFKAINDEKNFAKNTNGQKLVGEERMNPEVFDFGHYYKNVRQSAPSEAFMWAHASDESSPIDDKYIDEERNKEGFEYFAKGNLFDMIDTTKQRQEKAANFQASEKRRIAQAEKERAERNKKKTYTQEELEQLEYGKV